MSNASNKNEMKDSSSVPPVDKASLPNAARKRHRGGGGSSGNNSNHSSNNNNNNSNNNNIKKNHRGGGRHRRLKPENDNRRNHNADDRRRSSGEREMDEEGEEDERKPAAATSLAGEQLEDQPVDSNNNDDDDDETSPPPITWLLQCATTTPNNAGGKQSQLWWYSPALPTKLSQEQAVLAKLLRWKQKERGMMKSQPHWRIQEIIQLCQQVRIPLDQALSLRRHHIKRLNPYKRMPALGLGQEDDIRESARLFEEAVADCLRRHSVAFYTELDQKRHYDEHKASNGKDCPLLPATPDFLLKQPVEVTKYYHHHKKRIVVDEPRQINWLEAKMFYGACSIDEDNVSAVGRIMPTARKYTKYFGPGAFVFMQGCGEDLVRDLARVGVMALDCSGSDNSNNNNNNNGMVNLTAVLAHQQTWCADAHGNILP